MPKMTVNSNRPTYTTEYIKADTEDRAVFLGNPHIDSLYGAMTALSSYVWALTRKVNVMESLLDKNGSVTREAMEKYLPTAEENKAWTAQRDQFASIIFDAFSRRGDIPYASSIHPAKIKD